MFELKLLVEYTHALDELTSEDLADIEAGKAEMASGEGVSLDEFCGREGL